MKRDYIEWHVTTTSAFKGRKVHAIGQSSALAAFAPQWQS